MLDAKLENNDLSFRQWLKKEKIHLGALAFSVSIADKCRSNFFTLTFQNPPNSRPNKSEAYRD